MPFNSLDFAIFLPIVFGLYWFVANKNLKLQNLLIVIASYVFYGWWDWRFLSLILISSLVDYFVGLGLLHQENERKRKFLLCTSIVVNLGLLGYFKYYNFFVENFVHAFTFLGYTIKANSLYIILPAGISFYTFQTLSYSIDVYHKRLTPTRDLISFLAFVSFFPQLVAGPIERATHLLPQFSIKRSFDYQKSVDGLRQILWGLFKKIVIADNCAEYANLIFNNSDNYPGSVLFLGGIFFAFQIYGDFSGYSDIAVGTSRLFGFDLMRNFAFPYFSRDPAEFWRRWHISLTTWFRDYVYIPLGGSRGNIWEKIRNTFLVFIVSGFWHGANWTFVVWGALNAFYFLPLLVTSSHRNNIEIVAKGNLLPTLKEFLLMLSTFILIVFSWIFFRAENIGHAWNYISRIFSLSMFTFPKGSFFIGPSVHPYTIIFLIVFFILIEWSGREGQYAISNIDNYFKRSARWATYSVIATMIVLFAGKEQQFIYFQF